MLRCNCCPCRCCRPCRCCCRPCCHPCLPEEPNLPPTGETFTITFLDVNGNVIYEIQADEGSQIILEDFSYYFNCNHVWRILYPENINIIFRPGDIFTVTQNVTFLAQCEL